MKNIKINSELIGSIFLTFVILPLLASLIYAICTGQVDTSNI